MEAIAPQPEGEGDITTKLHRFQVNDEIEYIRDREQEEIDGLFIHQHVETIQATLDSYKDFFIRLYILDPRWCRYCLCELFQRIILTFTLYSDLRELPWMVMFWIYPTSKLGIE
jgi:hypothetical protein